MQMLINKYHFDESLFTHCEGKHIWIIGLINWLTNDIRLEIVEKRNQQAMQIIIEKHVGKGNIINSHPWPAYNFLDNIDSGYMHNICNHISGILGLTSRIESKWN